MKKKYDFAIVSGGFDPVHVGHLRMFQDAKKIADKVILLLNNDEWLIKKKGKPFMNQNQRKEILEEFISISEVIIQSSSEPSSSKAIEEFVLRGRLLKQVSSDLTPHLAGIVDGLVAEALNDEEVNIYRLERGDEVKAIPFMTWKAGEVEKSASKRGMVLDYVVPEGRSKGMFMSKTNKVMVPLLR